MRKNHIAPMSIGGGALGGVVGYLLAAPVTAKSIKFKKKYDDSIEELESNIKKVRALEFKGGRTENKREQSKELFKKLQELKRYGILTPDEKSKIANLEASIQASNLAGTMTGNSTRGTAITGVTALMSNRLQAQIEVIKAKGMARAESAIKKLTKKRAELNKLNLKSKDHQKLNTLRRRSTEIREYKEQAKKYKRRRNLIVGAGAGLGLLGGGLAGSHMNKKELPRTSVMPRPGVSSR